jgi:hypothetical protein
MKVKKYYFFILSIIIDLQEKIKDSKKKNISEENTPGKKRKLSFSIRKGTEEAKKIKLSKEIVVEDEVEEIGSSTLRKGKGKIIEVEVDTEEENIEEENIEEENEEEVSEYEENRGEINMMDEIDEASEEKSENKSDSSSEILGGQMF